MPDGVVVYVPKGTLKAYSVADGWSYFTDFREMGAFDIILSNAALTLDVGETATLTASVTKDDDMTIESETWTSSNPEVAAVDGGDAPAEYYNLSDVCVSGEALTPGLYIKHQCGKAIKVQVK